MIDDATSSAAADIVRVCRRLYAAGLIAGQDGNVSVRLSSGDVLVTPRGFCKVDVGELDLVTLDIHGRHVSGTGAASSEIGMHLRIYQRRPDVNAVVHAHPPVATGFGVAGLDLMDDVLPEAIFLLGGVPLVPYGMPGTPALGDSLERYLPHHDGFLLANHGATTVGASLRQAHQRMESLEHTARIMLTAKTLGSVNPLAPEDAQALRAMRVAARNASPQQTETRSHERE